jgi:hypothetical protein
MSNGIPVPAMTPQNFSIPAGYNELLIFTVSPIVVPSLVGTVIVWRVYEEALGIPTGAPILSKSTLDSPTGDVVPLESPLSFTVQMYTADTINLLRNYYHEATIYNAVNEVIGGSWGIMTVTMTENRP